MILSNTISTSNHYLTYDVSLVAVLATAGVRPIGKDAFGTKWIFRFESTPRLRELRDLYERGTLTVNVRDYVGFYKDLVGIMRYETTKERAGPRQ